MSSAASWAQPHIEWGAALDVVMPLLSLPAGAERLVTWPATEFETTATDCFTLDDQIWIWQPGVGAVWFRQADLKVRTTNPHDPQLFAFPWPGADPERFRQVVTRSWLPAIYPLWGRQVLHASAVVCSSNGAAVAFTGPTHAGKSTTAFGLGRRPGWRPVCDDTLAFSPEGSAAGGSVRLHPIPNEARLRPASADYYGQSDSPQQVLTWPDGVLQLAAVYFIEGSDALETPAEFTVLRAAEALPLLLQQAYALSLEIPKYNQQLMKDYVALATRVPIFRLRFRRSFDVAEELFASIEGHLAAEAGLRCTPAGFPAAPAGLSADRG